MSNELPKDDLGPLGQCLLDALDHAGVGVTVIVDRGGRLERLFMNETGAATLGYTLEEAMQLPPMLAVTPEDRSKLVELHESGAVPRMIECTVTGKDGRNFPVEVGMAATAYRGDRATVAFLRDLSERTEIERALRESETRFKKLVEFAPDVIAVLSDERFVYVNPTGLRAMRFEGPEDYATAPASEFLAPTDLDALRALTLDAGSESQVAQRECRIRRRDGSALLLEVSAIAVEWEGQPAALAFGRDVTERAELLSRVAEHDRLAAVGTLAAGIAHEINNPLTYLMLRLEHLQGLLSKRLGPDTETARQHLGDALDGAERVSAIVKDLLELSRPRGPRLASTDLSEVLEGAVRLARPTVDGHAEIRLAAEAVGPIDTDAARLTQVLLNLLVNAAESSDGERATQIEVRSFRDGERAVIEVLDDGHGIAEEVLPSLFLPFFTTKGADPRPGRHRGLGLGLSVCRSIIQSLSGTISGANRAEGGAVFRIELPTGPLADRHGR